VNFIAERNVKIDEETNNWQLESADRITMIKMVPTKAPKTVGRLDPKSLC
jgi:hypothetical protein